MDKKSLKKKKKGVNNHPSDKDSKYLLSYVVTVFMIWNAKAVSMNFEVTKVLRDLLAPYIKLKV